MLSDHETAGGAAIAACRLANGFVGQGIEIIRVVRFVGEEGHPWQTKMLGLTFREDILFRIMTKAMGSMASKVTAILHKKRLSQYLKDLKPDVINVHNIHGAGWSLAIVGVCAQYAPTVWTLHDMWSFTGRCAYSYDCRKFIDGCDASCPTPKEYPSLQSRFIEEAWKQRRSLLSKNRDLLAVTPSRWLAREAQAGLWARDQVTTIPNGLFLDVYRPVDRDLARKALGIETQGPVLMVVAQKLRDPRKGWNIFIDALKRSDVKPVTLVTLGSSTLKVDINGVYVKSLGYIDHERTKVLAYCAADLLIHPSFADNLPNVAVEAIACGTPVIGFDIGGISDIVRTGMSGWLCKAISSEALAVTIKKALNAIRNKDGLRESCRALAESEFDLHLQAERYIKLFGSLVEKWRAEKLRFMH